MKANERLRDARVFVSTYAKRENDDPRGWWIRVASYQSHEEFLEACRELHRDEKNPVLFFKEFDGIPEIFIKENSISPKLIELCHLSARLDCYEKEEAFLAWLRGSLSAEDLEETPPSEVVLRFQEAYVGSYDTTAEFAREILENFEQRMPKLAYEYFDYERYANDLLLGDFWRDGRHYFRVG